MDYYIILIICVNAFCVYAKNNCEKTNRPLEVGIWRHDYKRLDSAVVENKPVSMSEGQIYVYENDFPGYTIKYIHVDNLAVRTCGASAVLKTGGVGTSTVLIILHASTNQEIRSVVDIWGIKTVEQSTKRPDKHSVLKTLKSLYLHKGMRTINHNN